MTSPTTAGGLNVGAPTSAALAVGEPASAAGTLGLAHVNGRCEHGYAPIQHPRYCQCAQVPAAKAQGIAQADRGTPPEVKARLRWVIRKYAATGWPFSANDMRVELAGISGPRVGAAFKAAETDGLIRGTGDRVPSNLASTHGHRIDVWIGAAA